MNLDKKVGISSTDDLLDDSILAVDPTQIQTLSDIMMQIKKLHELEERNVSVFLNRCF